MQGSGLEAASSGIQMAMARVRSHFPDPMPTIVAKGVPSLSEADLMDALVRYVTQMHEHPR